MAKKTPAHKITYGRISAAIWENQSSKSGETFYNVTVERTYYEGDEPKNSTSFGRDDLLLAAKALDQAHTWICERMAPAAADTEEVVPRCRRSLP